MIVLKKILILLVLVMFSFALIMPAVIVRASNNDTTESMMEGKDDASETEVDSSGEDENLMMEDDGTESEVGDETDDMMDSTMSGRMESAVRKAEQLKERINNPEVGEQLQNSVEAQQHAQERIQETLTDMKARPGFLRFILGPDYKNAGQVRSQLVQMKNQINQLTRLKASIDDPESQQQLQGIIDDLQSQSNQLELQLNNSLTGFSLFGWLSRILSGY